MAQLTELEEFERLCGALDDIFPDTAGWVRDALGREVEGGVSLQSLAKLAFLMGVDQPKNRGRMVVEKLRLGRKASEILGLLLTGCGDVMKGMGGQPPQRVMYRFFRDREPAGPALVLMALTRGDLPQAVCARLYRYGRDEYEPTGDVLLLSGDEVMALLGISPGPKVGKLMELLREAECTGMVTTADEARSFVKNLLTKE